MPAATPPGAQGLAAVRPRGEAAGRERCRPLPAAALQPLSALSGLRCPPLTTPSLACWCLPAFKKPRKGNKLKGAEKKANKEPGQAVLNVKTPQTDKTIPIHSDFLLTPRAAAASLLSAFLPLNCPLSTAADGCRQLQRAALTLTAHWTRGPGPQPDRKGSRNRPVLIESPGHNALAVLSKGWEDPSSCCSARRALLRPLPCRRGTGARRRVCERDWTAPASQPSRRTRGMLVSLAVLLAATSPWLCRRQQ